MLINQREYISLIIRRYLKSFRIFQSETDIRLALKSHPDFPSLWSVAQTLSYFGVATDAFSGDYEALQKITNKAIVHLNIDNGVFVTVEKISSHLVTIYDARAGKKISLPRDRFLQIWSGIIIVGKRAVKNTTPRKTTHIAEIIIGFTLLFYILFYASFSKDRFCFYMFLLNIAGLFAVGGLTLKGLGYSNSFVDQLCTALKSFSCNQSINIPLKFGYMQIPLTKISSVFFLSGTLIFMLCPFLLDKDNLLFVLQWITIGGAPVVLASLGYQIMEKKLCPFCFLIAIFFSLQLLLFTKHWQNTTNMIQTVIGGIFILIMISFSVAVLYLVEGYIYQWIRIEKETERILCLKRRSFILAGLFQMQPYLKLEKELLFFGNDKANIIITTVLSSHCSPCKQVALYMISLLQRFPDSIKWRLFFDGTESNRLNSENEFPLYLIMLSIQDKEKQTEFIYDWAINKSMRYLKKKYALITINEEAIEILNDSTENIQKHAIEHVPYITINNIELPPEYKINDIPYLLLDEDEFLNILSSHPMIQNSNNEKKAN